jgi:predicted lipid carrier protein YhbT
MLELQQAYFKASNPAEKRSFLIASKQAEKAVKAACQAIVATISPDPDADTLFLAEETPE